MRRPDAGSRGARRSSGTARGCPAAASTCGSWPRSWSCWPAARASDDVRPASRSSRRNTGAASFSPPDRPTRRRQGRAARAASRSSSRTPPPSRCPAGRQRAAMPAPSRKNQCLAASPKCREALLDAFVERQRRDRQFAGAFGVGQRDRCGLEFSIEDGARAHLFPVVILGIDPEHRDRTDALVGRHTAGELDRGDGLEQREQRTAKGASLLTGDDGDRLRVAQSRGSVARGCRRTAAYPAGRASTSAIATVFAAEPCLRATASRHACADAGSPA